MNIMIENCSHTSKYLPPFHPAQVPIQVRQSFFKLPLNEGANAIYKRRPLNNRQTLVMQNNKINYWEMFSYIKINLPAQVRHSFEHSL